MKSPPRNIRASVLAVLLAALAAVAVAAEAGEPEPTVPPGSWGAAAGPWPTCAGMDKGAECWLELAGRPGCHIFDDSYDPPETATGSGACRDGFAVGQGTWEWENAS